MPRRTELEYAKHITAEEWRPTAIKDGKRIGGHWHQLHRQNHLLDNESMACAAAGMMALFGPMRKKRRAVAVAVDDSGEFADVNRDIC